MKTRLFSDNPGDDHLLTEETVDSGTRVGFGLFMQKSNNQQINKKKIEHFFNWGIFHFTKKFPNGWFGLDNGNLKPPTQIFSF